jgi:hypothetical protein
MIGIDDNGDGEYARVGQDLERDSGIAALTNRDWKCRGDLMAAEPHRLSRAAYVCHEGVESPLVIHVEAVQAEPGEQTE